jgi:hypothetical protein
MTCFSLPRMMNGLNLDYAPILVGKVGCLNPDLIDNLRVVNGLKVVLTLYLIYGNTYLYTYYSIVADPVQADKFRHSFWFLIVSGSLFTTPCLFWIAGFLHTISFLQVEEEKQFTFANISRWYIRKIIRYLPLVFITLLWSVFITPALGAGPVWELYNEKAMKGCESYWWTNLLFINNIVPQSSFDDKCMPWTWFIPCLLQVSLILPILLFAFTRLG